MREKFPSFFTHPMFGNISSECSICTRLVVTSFRNFGPLSHEKGNRTPFLTPTQYTVGFRGLCGDDDGDKSNQPIKSILSTLS